MIVPFAPGAPSSGFAQMPSETNQLMALAEMHKQGRFDQDANENEKGDQQLMPYSKAMKDRIEGNRDLPARPNAPDSLVPGYIPKKGERGWSRYI